LKAFKSKLAINKVNCFLSYNSLVHLVYSVVHLDPHLIMVVFKLVIMVYTKATIKAIEVDTECFVVVTSFV